MKTNAENRRDDDEIDLRLLFNNMRRKWHYFFISILVFVLAAFLYVHYTIPVFEASTSILIKDSKNSSKNIEDIMTGDLFGNSKNMATEIGILQSRSVLEETINDLNLGVSYFSNSGLIDFPLYKTTPFNVRIVQIADGIYDEKFKLKLIDDTSFRLELKAYNKFLNDYNFN
jgi:tyrosine-protein kinase Etk/Wzc